MGKPYLSELEQLEETYAFTMGMDIRHLIEAVSESLSLPLLIVGSGGSLTIARLIASLHQHLARMVAKPVTPLELFENNRMAPNAAIWFASAGGRNADIQAALRSAISSEPRRLLVSCAKKGSPLAALARKHNYTDIFEFDLPSQGDGFLATNSLLAFSVLFTRAYLDIFRGSGKLPPDLCAIMRFHDSQDQFTSQLREQCAPLWARENLVVLYGNGTEAAAYDLESKFTEAALGPVLLSDFRNFAHGRHHWLAKRGEDSAVLALTTIDERKLVQKTLELLPLDIPVVELQFSGERFSLPIQALVTTLHIVGLAGNARGIDPGRPGVPEFGRRIYNLRLSSHVKSELQYDQTDMTVAERRKLNTMLGPFYDEEELSFWRQAYHSFLNQFKGVYFSGVVFDYDDTLCDRRKRSSDLDDSITKELHRLLASGLRVGIATGRGKSVKSALRKAIPSVYWERILVGYYNGGECALLSDNEHPDGTASPCTELYTIAEGLCADPRLHRLFDIAIRRPQITIEPIFLTPISLLLDLANDVVQKFNPQGAAVVTSGHSVDILASGVTKRTIGRMMSTMSSPFPGGHILYIGDKGRWPGNDFDLLSERFSLSVDEVSSDPATCWNLAPVGYRGIQAIQFYFQHMLITENGLLMNFAKSKKVSK